MQYIHTAVTKQKKVNIVYLQAFGNFFDNFLIPSITGIIRAPATPNKTVQTTICILFLLIESNIKKTSFVLYFYSKKGISKMSRNAVKKSATNWLTSIYETFHNPHKIKVSLTASRPSPHVSKLFFALTFAHEFLDFYPSYFQVSNTTISTSPFCPIIIILFLFNSRKIT